MVGPSVVGQSHPSLMHTAGLDAPTAGKINRLGNRSDHAERKPHTLVIYGRDHRGVVFYKSFPHLFRTMTALGKRQPTHSETRRKSPMRFDLVPKEELRGRGPLPNGNRTLPRTKCQGGEQQPRALAALAAPRPIFLTGG